MAPDMAIPGKISPVQTQVLQKLRDRKSEDSILKYISEHANFDPRRSLSLIVLVLQVTHFPRIISS